MPFCNLSWSYPTLEDGSLWWLVGIGWGRLGKETHGRTIQKQTNKEHGRLWNSALKASGTAVIIAIKKKKQGPETGRNLPWDTQQVQIVGTGVLLSEADKARRHRAVGCGSRDWLWSRHCPNALHMASLPVSEPPGLTDTFYRWRN